MFLIKGDSINYLAGSTADFHCKKNGKKYEYEITAKDNKFSVKKETYIQGLFCTKQ